MRKRLAFAVGLLLLLGACGDRDTPQATTTQGDATRGDAKPADPIAEPAPAPAPDPAATPDPEPAQGGDEKFEPPENWCGTPGMWKKPVPDGGAGGGFLLFENDKGESRRVAVGDMTEKKAAELHKAGWRLTMRVKLVK